MNDLEIYKVETAEIIKRFLDHALTFPECISALDAALADARHRAPTHEQEVSLRVLASSNYEIVRKEMDRRESLALDCEARSD